MLTQDQIHAHLFNREYMSGVERDETRIKATAEVFTPKHLVDEILDKLEESDPDTFRDPAKLCLDPACGDGQFLAGALWRRVRNGIDVKTALATLYGVDLMPDNVAECRRRLACGLDDPETTELLRVNIQCQDALRYHFLFMPDDPQPGDWPAEWRKLDPEEIRKRYMEMRNPAQGALI